MTDYSIETMNVKFLNQSFLDKVEAGMTKEAGLAMSAFVRQRLREDGFTRKILTPQLITSSDLDRDLTDQPRKIVEKEPDSVAASIPLSGTSELRYFKGQRYEVTFNKIASRTFTKSKFELATYDTDIRQILQENSVKDLHTEEDSRFIDGLKTIATAQGTYYNMSAGFGIKTLINAINYLITLKQKPAKILIPYNLYMKLYSRPSSVAGSLQSDKHFEGLAMQQAYGFELIPTNKLEIMSSDPTNAAKWGDTIAIFAPEAYLGQFYSLQEPTVFLKTEQDMIEFTTYESVGVGIGNVNGFVLAKFDLTLDGDTGAAA